MFIKDMSCISTQATYFDAVFENGAKVFNAEKLWAEEPSYKGIIPNSLLRRMSKLVRMSVATGLPLIEKNENFDGIIFGSSNGSVERSLRFLNQIIDYDEGTLTPTDFVQSTPNVVAGVLALMGKITGYNTTHVNQGLSFESAILDALLLFEEGESKRVLLGGGEELSDENYNIDSQRGLFKEEEISTSELLHSTTKGTLPGEGVSMFVLNAKKERDSIAEIVDVDMICHASEKDLIKKVKYFLAKNDMTPEDIDSLFMGRNGDVRTDFYYDHLEKELFTQQNIFVYKLLTGDYYTVSAFATWLAAKLLSGVSLPQECIWKQASRKPKNVLLYNNYEGKQHGFILMRKV
jgi:hypothetical protein